MLDLAAIVADPARLEDVPRDELPALLARLEHLRAAAWARLWTPTPTGPPAPPKNGTAAMGRFLTAKETAEILAVSPRWIYRHANTLPFTRRAGGTLRFSEVGLRRWMERGE